MAIMHHHKIRIILTPNQKKMHKLLLTSFMTAITGIINRVFLPPLLGSTILFNVQNKLMDMEGVNIVRNYCRKSKSIINYTFTLLQLRRVHALKPFSSIVTHQSSPTVLPFFGYISDHFQL